MSSWLGMQPRHLKLVTVGRVKLCVDPVELADARDPTELPSLPCTALGQDARGFLWVGTQNGPMLFDGCYCGTPAALSGMGGSTINCLCFGGNDTVWAGTEGSGIAWIQIGLTGPRLRRLLTRSDSLPGDLIHSLCSDRRGRVWAGTPDGLALLEHGCVARVMGALDGLPAARVNALGYDTRDRLWVGTDRGVVVLVDGAVSFTGDQACPFTEDLVQRFYCDPLGQLWAGTRAGNLFRAEVGADGRVQVAYVHGWGSPIADICMAADGRLWVATLEGVFVLTAGVLSDHLAVADGLPSADTSALYCDRDGRMWAATRKGLAVLLDVDYPVHVLVGADLRARVVWNIEPDANNCMWLGTDSGLIAVSGEDSQVLHLPDLPETLRDNAIWAVRHDGLRQIWASQRRNGLFCLDASTGAPLAHMLADRGVNVIAMCMVGQQDLWLGTSRHGLICVDMRLRKVVGEIGTADGLPETLVSCLHLDGAGRLWAGTLSGRLVCIDPVQRAILSTLELATHGPAPSALCLMHDTRSGLWAGTSAGLMSIDPDRNTILRTIGAADGLRSLTVLGCTVDARGHLWLGTGCGVIRYAPDTGTLAVIDRSMGLPHDECDQNAVHLDDRGRLWIGTAKGPAIIDTNRIPIDVPPCPVVLTGFLVMGEERDVTPDLELEDSDCDLQFSYAAVSFTAPTLVLYRVQLEGFESGFSSPSTERSRRYTNLRPGAYVLRVSACNWGGTWSTPLEIPLRIVRNHQAQEAEEALEHERFEKEVYRAAATRLEDLNQRLAEASRLNGELLEQTRASYADTLARQERLSALQTISSTLAATRTPSEVGEQIMRISALYLDAPFIRIRLLSADRAWLEHVIASTNDTEDPRFPKRRPYDDQVPSAEAVRTGRPVWLESPEEMLARFPDFARKMRERGFLANVTLPLLTDGEAIGSMGLMFTAPRRFRGDEREFLLAVASLAAQAVDRAWLYAREQKRAQTAEDLARMRGDFVASVSHELRTPLTAIVGYAELLEARWSMLADQARLEHVRRIVWSANRQLRLVQDLLLVSKLDLGAPTLECRPVDLEMQVQLAIAELQGSYPGQRVETVGPPEIRVHADAARVSQILVNLLDNAAKYSPEGSPIEVDWNVVAPEARIRVRDYGPGIPAEGRQRLFSRFGRISGSRIRAGRVGTGMGLFLARQLARAMAGELELEDTGPQGTIFCLRLPLVIEGFSTESVGRPNAGTANDEQGRSL